MAQSRELDGQVALVTGASSGLGAHFARLLARHGAAVALAARRTDRLAALADEIAASGGRALPVALDVRDEASVAAAVTAAGAGLGPVTICVNNAGVTYTKRLLETTLADWEDVVDTNLTGCWLVARETGRHMQAHGKGGRIVNIASVLGVTTEGKGVMAYSAAKAGLVSMTGSLALELAQAGVLVNALAPGYIETDFNRDFLNSEPGQRLARRAALRRFGVAEDLDGPLLLLAGPGGAFMTGAVLIVDGGLTITTL